MGANLAVIARQIFSPSWYTSPLACQGLRWAVRSAGEGRQAAWRAQLVLLVEGWGVHASSCVRGTERQDSDRDTSAGCWWGAFRGQIQYQDRDDQETI